MTDTSAKIIYTHTAEAPALATYSFLPIIEAFAGVCGVDVETRDISLAGRIIANFPEYLTEEQRIGDALAELGDLTQFPEANIIKLPNISASIPQMKAAIAELQAQGYALPDYPEDPSTDTELDVLARYDKVKGSAVNPVLREGNSDRRAPAAVKQYARAHPHSMGAWTADSKTSVAHMDGGDFRSNEVSTTVESGGTLRIEHVAPDGAVTVLKESVPGEAGEVVDASFMSRSALVAVLAEQVAAAKESGVLCSLHMKATMMKVSDPIIFGHAVRVFFADVFAEHGAALDRIGANPNEGLGSVLGELSELDDDERTAVEAAVEAAIAQGPDLAMVDSDRGITNLHVPSDVIIDASMPAMIRTSGHMWNPAGEEQDTLAVIPDASYAGVYAAVIEDCKANGAYDPTTMGSVPNVGLMAKKAQEYGSHDKTFEMAAAGTVRVVDDGGATVFEHAVGEGDIWRMCQTKDAPIRDWVKLAVTRARATGAPAVFWLDETRAHDAQLIERKNAYLPEHDQSDIEVARLPSTSSSSRRRTTCGGTRSASSWRSLRRSRTSVSTSTTVAPRSWPPPSTPPRPSCSRPTSRRRARSTSSTTGAATSTSPSTGRRRWQRRPTTRRWPSGSPRSPRRWRRTRRRSCRRSPTCRANPRTSAATTPPTRRRPARRCGRARRSTSRWRSCAETTRLRVGGARPAAYPGDVLIVVSPAKSLDYESRLPT